MLIQVRLAQMVMDLNVIHPELHTFFEKYIVENETSELSLSWSADEIKAEQTILDDRKFPDSYLETLTALRKISEVFPQHNRFLIHGASISYGDKAYLFCAPSGTGKSTHIRLWRKFLGEKVGIVNGDKPFVSIDSEEPIIYGTPWAGKENWHRNCSFPLNGICFIKRGKQNTIRRLEPSECVSLLFKQIYLPKDSLSAGLTLELADKLTKLVPLYLLECDMSEDAVRCSFETLTGETYHS